MKGKRLVYLGWGFQGQELLLRKRQSLGMGGREPMMESNKEVL